MKTRSIVTSLVVSALGSDAIGRQLVETHLGNPEDYLGTSVASAGDFDGDGIADTIVGASEIGRAYVYSGFDGHVLKQFDWKWSFGEVVCGIGDVNHDGLDDIAISSPHEPFGGVVYLYAGGSGILLRTMKGFDHGDGFGSAICRAGDIDGDGAEELAIGAPGTTHPASGFAGAVYYYSFATDSFPRVIGPLSSQEDAVGRAVANTGDVNHDGVDDLIVGVTNQGIPGSARIHSGANGLVLRTFASEIAENQFGISVASLGPIGSGGRLLVAIGASYDRIVPGGGIVGSIRVFDAETGALVYERFGTVGSKYGAALASTDFVNDSSETCLVVGAPNTDGAVNAGIGFVEVLDGATGKLLKKLYGSTSNDAFGETVATIESRDSDDYSEIVVGAPQGGFDDMGIVNIYKGVTPCGPIDAIGTGTFGSLGIVPQLHGAGCLRAMETSDVSLSLSNGPHFSTTGLLFLGMGAGSIPLNPLCSLQFTQLIGSPLALPIVPTVGPFGIPVFGSGHLALSSTIPPVGAGLVMRMQMIVLDSGNPFGFSSTNALQWTFLL